MAAQSSQKGKKSKKKKPAAKPVRKSTKKTTAKSAKKSPKKPVRKTVKKPAGKSTATKRKKSGKKGVLIVFVVLAVLIAAGIGYLLFNLNFLVKSAIEKYGSQATQTAVRVQGVRISLKDGSGSIRGLTVANPKGFETPHAFSLGEIGVDIDLISLTGDEIGIEDIVIRAPEIFVEVNADKKNNLNELKKNLLAGAAPSASSASGEESEESLLFIRRILFTEGEIVAKVVPMNNQAYQLKMPSIEMRNLRGTPKQIAMQVMGRLTNQALAEVKKKGAGQVTEKIGDRAESLMNKQKKKVRL